MRRIFESNRGPTDARWAEIKRGLGPTTVSRVADSRHHRHANEHTMCLDTAFIDICLSNPTAHKTSFRLAAQPSYSNPPDFSRGATPPKGGETRALRSSKIKEDKVWPLLTPAQHTELDLNVYSHHRRGGLRNVSHLPHLRTTLQESSLTMER